MWASLYTASFQAGVVDVKNLTGPEEDTTFHRVAKSLTATVA